MSQYVNRFLLAHTVELIAEVLGSPTTPADLTISRYFARRRYLGSHDRGFIAETTYALLRDIIRVQMALGDLLSTAAEEDQPFIAAAAHFVGMDVERRMIADATEIPERDLARIETALAGAEARMAELPPAEAAAMRHSVPVWLSECVLEQYGADDGAALLESLRTQAPIVMRANRLACTREELIAALAEREIDASPGEWSPDAVVLKKRINAFTVPQFKQGWFELQDEGSQLLSLALDPHPNWRVFDACAGAGGKTLHLAAIMKGRGEVVAHDINERRLSEIRPRLKRSGAQNVRVMTNDEYLERRESLLGQYNAVLIDAPCSGTGVLRRNPGVRLTLEREVVDRLLPQQAQILDEYAELVRPGGLMLYATCSVLREENDEQVGAFLARSPQWERIPVGLESQVVDADGYYRVFPHRHGTDGFFGALLRRRE
jgi:16S rRNA (cytosine967-C5)-methyltransferase